MKAWELLGEAPMPDGGTMYLMRQDSEFVIRIGGRTLMSSRMHGSEETLAIAGCQHLRNAEAPRVLVGGLGMGFTLAATLQQLPADARVTVAELVPAVVEWNRGELGACAGYPLADRRARVVIRDVGDVLRGNTGGFDAVVLDVDNGPSAFTTLTNQGLYDNSGVDACYHALRPGGVLAVWAAWEDRKFEQRMRVYGFETRVDRVRARLTGGGPRHTIFVGVKSQRSRVDLS
jgi:spermidine synthase